MKVSLFSGVGSVGMIVAATGGPFPVPAAADPAPNIVIESFEFLPIFPGQSALQVVSVNNHGDFCGRRNTGFIIQAFRYLGNTPTPGSFSLLYNDINDRRDTVGNTFQVFPPSAVLINGFNEVFRKNYFYHSINNSGWIAGQKAASFGRQPYVRIDDLGETELPRGPFWRLIDDEGRVWGSSFTATDEQIVFKTRFGPVQNLGTFGADGAVVTSINRNGDIAGYTYVNSTDFIPTVGLAVVGNVEHHIVSETGNDATALAVTIDGQIIGTDDGLCTPECDGKVWVIKDGVRHNIDDEISATLGFFPTLWSAEAASEHGWVIGQATDPRTNTFHFFRMKIRVNVDSDGDGLLDFWESENGGIDGNGDGTIDFKPFDFGARPDHKDLFVEVDAGTIPLGDAEVSKLVFAFDNAPVENPDSTTGIRLHILRDETNLPLPNAQVFGGNFPEGFEASKAAHFGTVAERADPNAANILKAKAKAVRYCLIYDGLQFNGNAKRYNGTAEIGGNDFLVDFAATTFNDGFRDEDDRAATFMHEFGHTLGLQHGGALDAMTPTGAKSHQGKPNYPSVMNYALSHPMRWSSRFWTLDYSREELAPLDESALDENAGITSSLYRNYSMPYGNGPEIARSFRLVKLDGRRVDFNGDGIFSSSAAEDLNFLPESAGIPGTTDATPGDKMSGNNDWQSIVYRVVVDDKELAHDITIAEGCPDSESIAVLDAAVPIPCDADFNGDGMVDDLDFQIFVVAYDKVLCVEDNGGGGLARDTAFDCPSDLNNDRLVDDLDFQIFVVAYKELLCP
jgi:hypothetical protein